MEGDETQYGLLAIVAVVAIITILSMANPTPNTTPVTAYASSQMQPVDSYPAYSRMDYNSDGIINVQDARLLSSMIDGAAVPNQKIADIDMNGVVNEQDLEALNYLMRAPSYAQPQPTQTLPAPDQTTRTPSSSRIILNTNPSRATTLA